ncbi:hypothetical protein QP794_15710 [Paenibacillus sp. UMB7766-LJ446]|uniref:hypothetical protein n=1 Tax=Paenibacillus sp. UMB7766-LJ446 TaxID=3046313 RepID=UPI0025501E90|nr:hypothetical protein [Paenibacillus sp. UMB7766-LJ446]MDK8191533.1 hypothetical protein [Paenibacillus sp. UMB7766-LJ446]
MAEMIVGLSKSNAEMRTTIRYLDQIQRSTERLGRVRYQSLIKVNNELRTTGRRLESIYSTAVRLSRLRITPTVGLTDSATPALNGLLKKMKQIRSKMLNATANVQLKVKHQISGVSVNVNSQPLNVNSQPLIDALSVNTQSILMLSNKLDSINIGAASGGEEKPKTFLQKMKGMFDRGKSISSGVKKGFDARSSGKKLWREITSPSTPGNKWKKAVRVTKRGATFMNDFSTAGSDLIGGIDGMWGDVKGLFGGGGAGGGGASGIMSKLGGGLAKGAGKLFAPIRMLSNINDLASAPPEERARAVGSVAGSAVGTTLGSILGSVIPVGGTLVGGAIGGWLGEKAGGWVGDKVGGLINGSAEGVTKMTAYALKGVNNITEKTKDFFSGISSFFGGSKEETPAASPSTASIAQATTVAEPTPVPAGPPMPPPAYIPSALTTTGPMAYMNSKFGQPTAAGFMGTSVMQTQAMALGNGAQTTANANSKSSTMTVQISEEQMSSLSGYLKDFKTETTNQISVNVPQGAVQVTVRENAIDYDAISHQVGMRFAGEVRRAMENRKTIMA